MLKAALLLIYSSSPSHHFFTDWILQMWITERVASKNMSVAELDLVPHLWHPAIESGQYRCPFVANRSSSSSRQHVQWFGQIATIEPNSQSSLPLSQTMNVLAMTPLPNLYFFLRFVPLMIVDGCSTRKLIDQVPIELSIFNPRCPVTHPNSR